MKRVELFIFVSIAFIFASILTGCGKKVDENKSVSEVEAEAQKMNNEELQKMAAIYRDAILAKKVEIERIKEKLKELTKEIATSDEAIKLKQEIEAVAKSVKALRERFEIYYKKLKEKEGDLSGLELETSL